MPSAIERTATKTIEEEELERVKARKEMIDGFASPETLEVGGGSTLQKATRGAFVGNGAMEPSKEA